MEPKTRRAAALAALLLTTPLAPRAEVADFAKANQVASEVYGKAKEKYLTQVDPLILAVNGDIILIRGGQERSFNFVPDSYEVMKAVGHVPRSIWAALRPAIDGFDPKEDWRGEVRALRVGAERELANVATAPLTEAQKQRDVIILNASIALIDRCLAQGLPSEAELRRELRAVGPLLLADGRDSAYAQLATIDREVRPWWNALTPEEQARAMVVVNGPKTARVGNLVQQYFNNLLGEGAADTRVLFAEGAWDREAVTKMLASVVTDRRLSMDFFAQRYRMERDLLGDAAEARLLEMFGRLGAK
jgi:hypothetical protein